MVLCVTTSQYWHRPVNCYTSVSTTAQLFKRGYCFLVPSVAHARWLYINQARHFSICADVEYQLPAEFIRRLANACGGKEPNTRELCWLIVHYLTEAPDFLAHKSQDRYHLAESIAQLFKRYMIYRPDWLDKWSKGEWTESCETHIWQMHFWQKIAPHIGYATGHPLLKLCERIRLGLFPRDKLPHKVIVYLLPTLPPLFLEILQALSLHIEVHFYVLDPSREYWADSSYLKQVNAESYHSLLASWGAERSFFLESLREHQAVFCRIENDDIDEGTFVDYSVLESIQNSIYHLQPDHCSSLTVDDSLQIHCCLSNLHELRILKNSLHHLLVQHPDLVLSDILVWCLDLETLVPLIHSVFSSAVTDQVMSYHIVDHAQPVASDYYTVFLTWLQLMDSDFSVESVMSWLSQPLASRGAGLPLFLLEKFQICVRQAEVRWGVDIDHVQGIHHNTWSHGYQRVFLGYLWPEYTVSHWQGISPVANSEKLLSEVFLTLVKKFQQWRSTMLMQEHTLQEWSDLLCAEVTQSYPVHIFSERESQNNLLQAIRTCLLTSNLQQLSISFSLVKEAVLAALGAEKHVVPRAGITFAPFGFLRGLPSRVLACLSLNHHVCPRLDGFVEYDLMKHHLRDGDLRTDISDRGAFLDGLMNCHYLYLSYLSDHTGHGAPSIFLNDILEYLAQLPMFQKSTDPYHAVCRDFIFQHTNDFSGVMDDDETFFSAPLPLIASTPLLQYRYSLETLWEILKNPVRFFLRERVGARVWYYHPWENKQPFVLSKRLLNKWFKKICQESQSTFSYDVLLSAGRLPINDVGDMQWDDICYKQQLLYTLHHSLLHEPSLSLHVSVSLQDGYVVSAQLDQVRENYWLVFAGDYMDIDILLYAWLGHLLLTCSQAMHRLTYVIYGQKKGVFQTLDRHMAETYLSELCAWANRAHNETIPFFLKTSYAWMKGQEVASCAAVWEGSYKGVGEEQDPWLRIWPGARFNFEDDVFQSNAEDIFTPLLACWQDNV